MNKKIILVLIIIILVIYGAVFLNKKDDVPDDVLIDSVFITEKDSKLTEEERKIVEDKLADIQKKIVEIEDGNDKERYNLIMQLGFQKNVLGKLAEARDAFLKAAKIQPEDYTAPIALFHIYADMGDNQSARESIKKAIQLQPEKADSWRQYIQFEKERFGATNEKLEEIFLEAMAKTNSSVDIITVYAQFLEEKGDLQGAIEQWEKAIAAFSQNKDLYQQEISRLKSKDLETKLK